MRKRIIVSLATVATILGLGLASAVQLPKVFVCKYVGTPGVDERLQTGNNPISVSENAIPNFQGVGSFFADAQGRSYVLAVDVGQDEPPVSQCPAPQTPPETPPVTPPTTPPTTPPVTVTIDTTPAGSAPLPTQAELESHK